MNKINPSQTSIKFMLVKFKELLLNNRRAILNTFLIMVLFSPSVLLAQDNERKIHPQFLAASQSFKLKKGNDRLAEFNQIEGSLNIALSNLESIPVNDYFIGDYQINSAELVTLMGEPDVKVSVGIWVYNLKPSNGCKVIIGIASNGLVSFVTKKECN